MLQDSQRDEINRMEKDEASIGSFTDFVGTKEGADEHALNLEPNKENQRYVSKGLLDSESGVWVGRSSKGNSITAANLKPSPAYLHNFDQIRWN
jgi:hypothetical protein